MLPENFKQGTYQAKGTGICPSPLLDMLSMENIRSWQGAPAPENRALGKKRKSLLKSLSLLLAAVKSGGGKKADRHQTEPESGKKNRSPVLTPLFARPWAGLYLSIPAHSAAQSLRRHRPQNAVLRHQTHGVCPFLLGVGNEMQPDIRAEAAQQLSKFKTVQPFMSVTVYNTSTGLLAPYFTAGRGSAKQMTLDAG